MALLGAADQEDEFGVVMLCFLVQRRRVARRTRPVAGICSRCGGGARVAEMETATRFCRLTLHRRPWRAVVCTFCGAVLKAYQCNRRSRIYDNCPKVK